LRSQNHRIDCGPFLAMIAGQGQLTIYIRS
jgi:hypothetical protein